MHNKTEKEQEKQFRLKQGSETDSRGVYSINYSKDSIGHRSTRVSSDLHFEDERSSCSTTLGGGLVALSPQNS